MFIIIVRDCDGPLNIFTFSTLEGANRKYEELLLKKTVHEEHMMHRAEDGEDLLGYDVYSRLLRHDK